MDLWRGGRDSNPQLTLHGDLCFKHLRAELQEMRLDLPPHSLPLEE